MYKFLGKTRWVHKFLANADKMYEGNNPPVEVLYCYGVYQDLYTLMAKTIRNIRFHSGLPTAETLKKLMTKEHKILVIDDLQRKAVEDPTVELIFTQFCHHGNLSCIFLSQNLFMQGTYARTINLIAWYLVLLENVRDKKQVGVLASQMYPKKSEILLEAYEDATEDDWGYLFVDTSPGVRRNLRLRTNVFPGDRMIAYTPNR